MKNGDAASVTALVTKHQRDDFAAFLAREQLPASYASFIDVALEPIAERIARAAMGAARLVVGVTGAQGSGKSACAGALALLLGDRGLKAAVLSIDDFYLTKAERRRLASHVHPLLATRGVPGTHDVALGIELIERLCHAGSVAIPRFDKGVDDRKPCAEWDEIEGPVDVVLLEGWCVGARPQPMAALAEPINEFERRCDPDGAWRRYAADALAGPYQDLFDRIGFQALLRAPNSEIVLGWRLEQERKLRRRFPGRGQSDAQIRIFIQHYERLTRWIDADMPKRADVVIKLSQARAPLTIEFRAD